MATSTADPYAEPTGNADDMNWTAPGVDTGPDAGASGHDSSGMNLSQGAMIAIIVVVVLVSILGAASAILFFVAKKREWKVREKIRRSARKVVTALTPRRSQFPDSVKKSRSGRTRLADDVPPTPRLKPEDLEKGMLNGPGPSKKSSRNWSRKL